MNQLISLLVENKPGALMRVAGVLTARGYNIESLTVAEVDRGKHRSRITIVVAISFSSWRRVSSSSCCRFQSWR